MPDMEVQRMSGKRLLTVEELAAKLNISPRTIYNQVAPKAKKKFPIKPKRIGKLLRFVEADADEYIERL
jgi:excisionase family DNA binding protein